MSFNSGAGTRFASASRPAIPGFGVPPHARSRPTRVFPGDPTCGSGDDDDDGSDPYDIPLRLRPINSNMDRLLWGLSNPQGSSGGGAGPAGAGGMPTRLNYGFGMGAAGGSSGGGQPWAPWSPPSYGTSNTAPWAPPPVAAAAVPRGPVPTGVPPARGGKGRFSGEDDDDTEQEEDIPLRLKPKVSSFDALLLSTGTAAPPQPQLQPQLRYISVATTPAPAEKDDEKPGPAYDDNIDPLDTSAGPPPVAPSPTALRATAAFSLAAAFESALSKNPNPFAGDDSDSDLDEPAAHRAAKPYKARGQTPNRRLTVAELESLPDQDLLAQAIAALGYKSSSRYGDDDEEDEAGGGEDDLDNEWGGSGADRRLTRASTSQWEGEAPGVGVKLKKGSANFGMQWGVV
ncbi:hypothetical protein BDZ91DRAFT_768982 [Kalaharituber pfeilii]|nr:hypothetical protein BDZ91DRAFT_768982 [Kalaharituber pfeilii]